jgi:predicted RNA binding protein YcfA (HicA-like mRNA interferase family)
LSAGNQVRILRIECGQCVTTVPVHAGEDIGPGLLRRIERDLEP